ncbi:ABC transporter substrate-binding protein [Evansella sp. AB-rgal1]|uniref:ABC transporter substrate-binding protein n=1 Tax=Evansella sp. AB-rgal1 TaxID=3242696 RepID=UPI00359EB773
MKKGTSIVLLFLLLSVVLIACSGNDEGTSGTGNEADDVEIIGGDSDDAVELTFWTFQGLHVNFFEDAVLSWNEEFPDREIKLIAETYPYDNMHNNLLLALQSGVGAPDIADIEISRFSNFLQGDVQLLPLNNVIEPELANFVEARLDIYSKDGNYYGLPTHVGATVMYYNKEIMDEAGVNIDDIVTWDDYVEAGLQVKEATGKPITTIEAQDRWSFWPLITQRQSDFFDSNGNVTADNPENIEVLQFLKDMIHVHDIAIPTPDGRHHEEAYYGFMNDGGAASVWMPMWYMGRFLDFMPDLKGKMEIRPLPAWEDGGFRSAGMGGTGTVVTNQTEHEQLAKDFLMYAKGSEEGNIKLWEIMGFDPPRWDVWESDALQADNKYYQYFGDYLFDMLLDIREEIHPVTITEKTPDIDGYLNTNTYHYVLREGNQTPEEALKEAADHVR